MSHIFNLICSLYFLCVLVYADEDIDKSGYILYCPCMGGFGNQADHFLGALGFSKYLNRTLVLPPWVEYHNGELRSRQIPFDKYFNVSALSAYHRVLPMHQFMQDIAPSIWPPSKRFAFCYMERKSLSGSETMPSCNAKEGNPFGPFWDEFNVDFIASEYFGPLNYDVYHSKMAEKWTSNYPASEWPVLAFTGAPASFPVQSENRDLHKYLMWSDEIKSAATHFIQTAIPKGAFIGIHLRNGADWGRACDHIKTSPNLFSAAQCLGYRNERGNATMDMCLPSRDIIVRHLKRLIKSAKEKGRNNEVRSVFVASDSNHMINELTDALHRMKVSVLRHSNAASRPHVDLAILGMANHFVGNCISSFSAFVKRERDAHGYPSSFWGYPTEKNQKRRESHEEL